MNLAKKTYAALVNFFFANDAATRTESLRALRFFRVAVGTIVLLHFFAIHQDFADLFGTNGLIPWDVADLYVADLQLTLPRLIIFLEGYGVGANATLFWFQVLFYGAGVSLIFGFFPRISALVLLLLQVSMVTGIGFLAYGVDFFTSMALFYLILADTGKNGHPLPVRRTLQLHLGIAYFFSGLVKLLGFNWWNGESIWKAINLPYVNRDFAFDFTWLADYPFVFVAIGWATIVVELFHPFFITWKKTRTFWLLATVGMHFGIAIVMNLYYFSAMMIVWNLAAYHCFEPEKSSPVISTADLNRGVIA
ncbi:hypothetical protein [Neolewinella persica]|uniref:hypothetical protein n=1 Tax=Neolewinella persica TaxID=70998 RepID=UPI000378DBB8|nr:hypothetical protein [Neolewinella persica]